MTADIQRYSKQKFQLEKLQENLSRSQLKVHIFSDIAFC